jgi:putative SOS response-associated peptidase YedK
MCGRYRLSRRKQIIAEHFDATPFDDDWIPRYNIAPTQPVRVIRQHSKEPRRVFSLMRWGIDSIVGERYAWLCEHDKREIGNSRHQACFP